MFVELIFFLANNITDDYTGVSIVILSIAVNTICLPMYHVAEQWQEKERAIQKRLKPKIHDIKAVFKGDERYMILSAYYRQNNYHPIYALRSMFALLIQIPFFIAAYTLLSNVPVLRNSSFWFLHDLGSPDKLLRISETAINLLPIVMTVINLAASAVYVKGLAVKEKVQLYGMAVVFLVLLYNSPSGLVFYWTLNNIFSLLKNIFYKVRLSKKIWYIVITVVFIVWAFITKHYSSNMRSVIIVYTLTGLVIIIPIIWAVIAKFVVRNMKNIFSDSTRRFSFFVQSILALALFLGLVIPASTIASSPLEFVNFENLPNPLSILYYSGIQSFGCLLWCICLYKLFQENVQKAFTFGALMLLLTALLNAYIFQDGYGSINNLLMFSDAGKLRHSLREIVVNLVVVGVAGIVLFALLYIRSCIKYIDSLLKIVIASFFVITLISSGTIFTQYMSMKNAAAAVNVPEKAYKISKTGKNIFVLMLDRSMNFFIDPIFVNSELVKKEYTGFTLFENSIAFGSSTNFSTPSLFGGYEYTPENINKRSDELLVDKHNEALSVLPRLFSEHGWHVSFTDPCWLNYAWIPDLSVFSKYNITTKNIDGNGIYTQAFIKEHTHGAIQQTGMYGIRRNMFYFSVFRILPLEARRIFYANGMYGGIGIPIYSAPFFNAYSALENLTNEVDFVDSKDCINIIVNNVTHEPPKEEIMKMLGRDFLIPIANEWCLNQYTAEHFYANYLAHESCARFFKFLKDHNCWDNSRIIIIGDHGRDYMRTINMDFIKEFSSAEIDPVSMIPLIMFKDFNADGSLKKDVSFMTLADVPVLATQGLPPELQKNPFTGKSFLETQNKEEVKAITSGNWYANQQLKATQFEVNSWSLIKDDVYNPACWSRADVSGSH